MPRFLPSSPVPSLERRDDRRIDFPGAQPDDGILRKPQSPHTMRRAVFIASVLLAGLILSNVEPERLPELRVHPAPRTTLVGVGDILLGRSLGTLMEEKKDYSMAFRNIEPELQSADIAFANLEGPFCGEPPYYGEGMVFRVRPAAIAGLVHAGIDVLSVANNHFANGGDACMRFSLELAHGVGRQGVGASR